MMNQLKRLGIALIVAAIGGEFYSVMSRATVACSVPFTFSAGTTAVASQVNSNFTSIINCLGNAAAAGINGDITQLTGLTTPITPTQGGTAIHIATASSTGSANAQIVANTVPTFVLSLGRCVEFVAGFTNTAATTLNVGGTGATAVSRNTQGGGQLALAGGELVSGAMTLACYDGTQFQLMVNASSQVPVGTVFATASVFAAPSGYFFCQGQAVSRTTYARLFSLVGSLYGPGDGVTTFNIPDLQGRVIASVDNASGRINNACSGGAIGTGCGAQTLTTAQLPVHTPSGTVSVSLSDPGHTHTVSPLQTGANAGGNPNGVNSAGGAYTTSSSTTGISVSSSTFSGNSIGSGTAFTVPTLVLQYMIKY